MKFVKTALICTCISMALPIAAPLVAQGEVSAAPSDEEAAAIDRAIELGETIYRYDQAGWHTTDAMLAAIDDPAARGIGGWIINPVDNGHEAVFYRPLTNGFEAVWSGITPVAKTGAE